MMKKMSPIVFCTIVAALHLSVCAQNMNFCDSCIVVAQNYIWKYSYEKKTVLLDSAMLTLDLARPKCTDHPNLILEKLEVYSLKRQYDTAIMFLEEIHDELMPVSDMPFYWDNCKNRFYAMKYEHEGDFTKRDRYIRHIVKDIHGYLKANQQALDSICAGSNSIEISLNTLGWSQWLYFYYIWVIERNKNFHRKLYALLRKGYNHDYIEEIRKTTIEDDFLTFPGY